LAVAVAPRQVRSSRLWQDASVVVIIDYVLTAYRPLARYRWSDKTLPFMAHAAAQSLLAVRKTNLDFVRGLLAEEGLSWRTEQGADGHDAVIFAESAQLSAVPLDDGIRFHSVRARERQDTVQALHNQRRLAASLTTVLSYNYKAKQAVAARAPSRLASGAKFSAARIPQHARPVRLCERRTGAALRRLQMEGQEPRS
jgi:type VI secretion system secreted protein VgrG